MHFQQMPANIFKITVHTNLQEDVRIFRVFSCLSSMIRAYIFPTEFALQMSNMIAKRGRRIKYQIVLPILRNPNFF